MTCISEAVSRNGDGSLAVDKAVLRKIVTAIFAAHWERLEPAFKRTKAKVNLARLRPGDISQRLTMPQLKALATYSLTVTDVVNALNNHEGGDKPIIEVSQADEDRANHALKWALAGEIFGPYPAEFAIDTLPHALNAAGGPLKPSTFERIWVLVLEGESRVICTDNVDGTTTTMAMNCQRSSTHKIETKSDEPIKRLLEWTSDSGRACTHALAKAMGIALPEVQSTQPEAHTVAETIDVNINPTVSSLVNSVLTTANLPPIEKLLEASNNHEAAKAQLAATKMQLDKATSELADLRTRLSTTTTINVPTQPVAASGEWPAYKVIMKSAADVFDVPAAHRKSFEVDLPYIEWDGAAPPCVPAIDPDYILRPQHLMSCIFSIVTNTNVVATGETGTGKTTLFEQVAARLRMPVEVINLDSEITRMDIMGRDVLTTANGVSITRFEEGIVPRAMKRPGFLILDEFDFGRPDVMYALQRVLTGTGLTLTEDGGRFIAPHPLFRIAATGNTKGQGDETGFYQGARIQSAALLNRFGVWTTVDYMGKAEVESLLKKRVEIATDDTVAQVSQYTIEHQRAFSERTVATPFSMRDAINLTRSIALFQGLMAKEHAAAKAIKQTVLARATDTDAATLKGIADRIFV